MIQRCKVLSDFIKVNKSIVTVIKHKNKQVNSWNVLSIYRTGYQFIVTLCLSIICIFSWGVISSQAVLLVSDACLLNFQVKALVLSQIWFSI